ncbi:type II toxin-antitoxin system PemK/MazF family toxin [Candidatus Woesearchaeota archaeon]|nr:type II toxin-antitoxin system PemK/MazF family toxin [Candidatus Woesearchaeota archaeon]
MERLVKGEVVVLPFPFSDLSNAKKRPALVISVLKGDDVILSQITSQARKDEYAISLIKKDFAKGKLNVDSYIRPNRLFTADKRIVKRKIGRISNNKIKQVVERVCEIIKN